MNLVQYKIKPILEKKTQKQIKIKIGLMKKGFTHTESY